MTEAVRVKAQLITNRHDALIDFYGQWPRMIANKLLMQLSEVCLREYPPKLANLSGPDHHLLTGEERGVSFRFTKESAPLTWAFYHQLPHGARQLVLTNALNGYAQLAEADRSLLEKAWSKMANPPEWLAPDTTVASQSSEGSIWQEQPTPELQAGSEADAIQEVTAAAEPPQPFDPLDGFEVGL